MKIIKQIITDFFNIDKKDRIVFYMLCLTVTNFLMATVKLVLSLTIPSLWFFVNAGFGFILATCRFMTIRRYKYIRQMKDENEKLNAEYINFMKNGVMLILLGIMYFFVSSYMYYKGTNTNMHEYITYLVALIAFTSIGSAIYGMIKYKRTTEPVIKGIKLTNFANALTSIVLTQVVLLDTFAKQYDSRLNGCTGMGVSLIIIILGLHMVISVKKDINKDNV